MTDQQKNQSPKIKIAIAILLALFLVSAAALSVRIVYLNRAADRGTTIVVPDNVIGEIPTTAEATTAETGETETTEVTKAESTAVETVAPTQGAESEPERTAAQLSLYKGRPSDNEKFQVANMLPGDREEKYFAIKVTHSRNVMVYFDAEVKEQTKNLANVLHIKVTHLETGKVLYDGPFSQMSAEGYGEDFAAGQSGETVAYYKIEVSLPTSTGNEYQAARLTADFRWYVRDTGALENPKTGDSSNLMLYGAIMCGSLATLLLLLFFRSKRKEDEYAEK